MFPHDPFGEDDPETRGLKLLAIIVSVAFLGGFLCRHLWGLFL